jgi:cytochrome b involved in lipid metabolism
MKTNPKESERIFESEDEVMKLYKDDGLKVVIYEGVVYDVEEYMGEHPGGADVIEAELGKNIEEPFEEAEHTKSAKNIFKDLPIVGKMS